MEKGFMAAFIVVLVIGAVIGLVMLTDIVKPLTHYTDTSGELMNLTGNGYLKPSTTAIDSVAVFNDTNCTSNQLVENSDYMIDLPYNGDITGAEPTTGPVGSALEFGDGDSVVMEETNSKANLEGDLTIIGWVKPTNL